MSDKNKKQIGNLPKANDDPIKKSKIMSFGTMLAPSNKGDSILNTIFA
jgi:hypothetical protein